MQQEEISWHELVHSQGAASDVPGILASLTDAEPGTRQSIMDLLRDLMVEEGTLYPATPFIIERFLDATITIPTLNSRELVHALQILASTAIDEWSPTHQLLMAHPFSPCKKALEISLGVSSFETSQREISRQVRQIIANKCSVFLDLTRHPDPHVRTHAASLIGLTGTSVRGLAQELADRAQQESVTSVKASMIIAVGMLLATERNGHDCGQWERKALIERLRAWTTSSDNVAIQSSACGALRWAGVDEATDRRVLAEALQKVPTTWQQAPLIAHTAFPFLWRVYGSEDLDQIVEILAHILNSPEARRRHDVVQMIGVIMATYREAPQRFMPLLQAHVDEDHPRVLAALLTRMAWAGRATVPLSDTLANALNRLAPKADSKETLQSRGGGAPHLSFVEGIRSAAAASLEGLAQIGDRRCLSFLIEDVREPQLPLDLESVLYGMRSFKDQIMPALQRYLKTPYPDAPARFGARMPAILRGLAKWDRLAVPLLPEIIHLLTTDIAVPADIAHVLGHIGEGAERAIPSLRTLLEAPHPGDRAKAAWALWRITGEPAEAIDTLTRLLSSSNPYPDAIDLVADLGPEGAPAIDLLRPMIQADSFWIRTHAAHAMLRITGDVGALLPILLEGFRSTSTGLLILSGLRARDIYPEQAVSVIRDVSTSRYRVPEGLTTIRAIIDDEALHSAATSTLASLALSREGEGPPCSNMRRPESE